MKRLTPSAKASKLTLIRRATFDLTGLPPTSAELGAFIADARPSLVRLAEPDPELSADLWLLTHPDLRHAPRVRVFLDFLAAEITKQRRLIEGAGSIAAASGTYDSA